MNDHLLPQNDHDDLVDLRHGHVPKERWEDTCLNQLCCHLRHSFAFGVLAGHRVELRGLVRVLTPCGFV